MISEALHGGLFCAEPYMATHTHPRTVDARHKWCNINLLPGHSSATRTPGELLRVVDVREIGN